MLIILRSSSALSIVKKLLYCLLTTLEEWRGVKGVSVNGVKWYYLTPLTLTPYNYSSSSLLNNASHSIEFFLNFKTFFMG